MTEETQMWELWYPDAGATGLPFARSRIAPTDTVWVHALPRRISVTVRRGGDDVVARGEELERDGEYLPMTRLSVDGDAVAREDRWPNDADVGQVVILPGGEAGILTAWWNAEDGSAWRWSVEFNNQR